MKQIDLRNEFFLVGSDSARFGYELRNLILLSEIFRELTLGSFYCGLWVCARSRAFGLETRNATEFPV